MCNSTKQLEEQLIGKMVLCDNLEEKDLAEIKGVACRLYWYEDHPPFTEPLEEVSSVYLTRKVAKDIGDYLRYTNL